MYEDTTESPDRSTADFLDDLDRQETSGPDDEEDEADTADPDDTEADEVGAPVANVRASVLGQLDALLKRNGGKTPTRNDLVGMVLHHRKAARRPLLRRPAAPPPFSLLPRTPIPRRVLEFKNDVFSNFRRQIGRPVLQTKGFYFGLCEVIFRGEGSKEIAALTLDPSTFRTFHEAVDLPSTRLGTPHKVTPADTNLQNPGENLYPNEVMVITHLTMELAGYRVLYDRTTLEGIKEIAASGNMMEALTGQHTLFDDGLVLPSEIYDQYTGKPLLTDALYPSGVLYFAWQKRTSGASNDTKEIFINHIQALSDKRKDLHETSGGAASLAMNEGYVWTLNQQNLGYNGVFEVRLKTHDSLLLPITPVVLPPKTGTPIVPQKLAAYYRITVYGDVIRPENDVLKPGKADR